MTTVAGDRDDLLVKVYKAYEFFAKREIGASPNSNKISMIRKAAIIYIRNGDEIQSM